MQGKPGVLSPAWRPIHSQPEQGAPQDRAEAMIEATKGRPDRVAMAHYSRQALNGKHLELVAYMKDKTALILPSPVCVKSHQLGISILAPLIQAGGLEMFMTCLSQVDQRCAAYRYCLSSGLEQLCRAHQPRWL